MTVQVQVKSRHIIAAVMNFGQFTKDCDEHYSTTFTAPDTAIIVFPYQSTGGGFSEEGVFANVVEPSLNDSFERGWEFLPDDSDLPFPVGDNTP